MRTGPPHNYSPHPASHGDCPVCPTRPDISTYFVTSMIGVNSTYRPQSRCEKLFSELFPSTIPLSPDLRSAIGLRSDFRRYILYTPHFKNNSKKREGVRSFNICVELTLRKALSLGITMCVKIEVSTK